MCLFIFICFFCLALYFLSTLCSWFLFAQICWLTYYRISKSVCLATHRPIIQNSLRNLNTFGTVIVSNEESILPIFLCFTFFFFFVPELWKIFKSETKKGRVYLAYKHDCYFISERLCNIVELLDQSFCHLNIKRSWLHPFSLFLIFYYNNRPSDQPSEHLATCYFKDNKLVLRSVFILIART